jgi:transposase
VNNFAAKKDLRSVKGITGRNATSRSRSRLGDTESVAARTPVGSCLPVPRSERTSPFEGPRISMTTPGKALPPPKKPMKTFAELTHYAGLDWAKDHHDVVIVERSGKVVEELRFGHTAEGWQQWGERVKAYPALGVAVETSSGPVVEQLLASGVTVFALHPISAQRYRDRKAPSGTKTDRLDAWSFADALRTDGHGWKSLQPLDPHIQELRLLCRDEVELIGQRTALINQLQAAVGEYYPAALEAFDDWTLAGAWAFIEQFPTPQALVDAGKRKWEKFLHVQRLYRPQTVERRVAIFARATDFCAGAAITRAKSRLALSLVKTLQALEKQLREYRQAIAKLFAEHPDHDLFGSLPGAGEKLAPRLLSELGDNRQAYDRPQSLQCVAGTAPISFQSGQLSRVKIRWHCNKHLRAAVHLWADLSRQSCTWAQAYYQAHRQKGQSHACALRCLGNRWLKILWKMWQTKTAYDSELHARNQKKHGSWLLQFQPA